MSGVPQLLEALNALYHGDPAVKDHANKWLEHWQQSPDAWQVCNDVLHSREVGLEAHYFCAQTLRTKVQRDFEELPPSALAGLRDSLVSLLITFGKGSPPVRTQLCLAIAALAAHLSVQHWGPNGVVGWLAQRLNSEAQDISLPCMLELLIVLPQESSSYMPSVRPERRREAVNEMVAATPQALQILTQCLTSQRGNTRAQTQALDAFTSWLKLAGGVGLSGAELASSPLVAAALGGLKSADTFFEATDAVIELIYCTSERGKPKEEMAGLVQMIVPEVMALRPRFLVCCQQARAEQEGATSPEGDHDESEETAKGMARLFAEVGEAYTDLISSGAPAVVPPVEALLDVASHPDDSICSMSFNFWHRLARALTSGLHPQPIGTDEPAISDEERARRVSIFSPIYERLVTLIRGRVRFPDNFDSWQRDDRQDFKRARMSIGDTLMDAAAVLGGGRMLQLLVEPLLELSRVVGQGQPFDWRTAEAALYCIRAVHRCAPLPGDPLLLSLFQALPALPQPPPLQYTVALTVGAYADWLADTAMKGAGGAQALIGQLLQMLIKGLSEEEASSACALSIRRLCDGCARLLGGHMEQLMGLYRQIQGSGEVAENSYDLDLDEDDVQQLIEGVALVASSCEDGQRQRYVQQMLDIVTQPMQQILTQAPVPSQPPSSPPANPPRLQLVIPLLERVTVIFRSVRDPADVAEALIRLWPWIEMALDQFMSNGPAIERICRTPRYALRSAGKAAAPALQQLVHSLPQRFQASRHSAFLYVASEVIKVFGDEPARDGELGPMLTQMMSSSCSTLRSLSDFSAQPDLADDTFLLAGRALSYAPRLVLSPPLLPNLLDAALAGLLVQHREACCSILAFIVRLLDPATHRRCPQEAMGHLQQALAPRALLLVRLLLAGVVGALPSARQQEITDVLYAILKVASQNGVMWVSEALGVLPEESATSADRQRFLQACHTVVRVGMGVAAERGLQDAVDELSEVCRRNRRSQQAAQRALLPAELHGIIA